MARNVVSGKHHIAFIDRYCDVAMVTIHPFDGMVTVNTKIEEYETLGVGAAKSARASIARLDRAVEIARWREANGVPENMRVAIYRLPYEFIRDCEECDVDIGDYANGYLIATSDQFENLKDRAKHYATGSLDAAPGRLIGAAKRLYSRLKTLDREQADVA